MPKKKEHSSENYSAVLPPIRCTPEDKSGIQKRAAMANMSLSEFIRHMSLNGKIVIKQSDADFETIFQLKKLGVNLNQQTKLMHSMGRLPVDLNRTVLKLEELIEKMIEKI